MEVVLTSPWVPAEWVQAHGHEPRGVWSLPEATPATVAEGVCAFAQRLRGLAEASPARPIIFTTACDQMRRAADAACEAQAAKVFLFNLPATWQTAAARRLYHAEVERLGRFLERLGGQTPTADALRSVISEYDRQRERGRALVSQPCGGASVADGLPLALVGGPLLPAQQDLFDTIKSAGGLVVLNATEPGERNLLPPGPQPGTDRGRASEVQLVVQPLGCREPVREASRDESSGPLAVLCNHYFDHIVDAFQRPNSRLYNWLGPRLAERRVRGIVLWVHVGCDLWRAEAASFREAFGLPVLVLDSTGASAGGLRDLNRLAAFIESLR